MIFGSHDLIAFDILLSGFFKTKEKLRSFSSIIVTKRLPAIRIIILRAGELPEEPDLPEPTLPEQLG